MTYYCGANASKEESKEKSNKEKSNKEKSSEKEKTLIKVFDQSLNLPLTINLYFS
jgi:hypothetical protein